MTAITASILSLPTMKSAPVLYYRNAVETG